ncbi:MAG: hypothetical protein JWQ49_5245 [Edaphobacter sp.]|nr:hypothetical protein [Edaphobacter sp.]
MERRDFLAGSSMAAVVSVLSEANLMAQPQRAASPTNLKSTFNLTAPYDTDLAISAYTGQRGGAPSTNLPPQVFLYYDNAAATPTFVNPLDLKVSLEASTYELDVTLYAFNIAKSSYISFKSLQQQLQLGLNVTGPAGEGQDDLTWMFMHAIDVFFQKPAAVPAQLSNFQKYSPTQTLTPSSKITVTGGQTSLQVTAFGQKKGGFWTKLFDMLSKAADSPLLSAFSIPSLVKQSVDFVDKSLDVLAAQDKLVPIWQTHPITFAIDKSAKDTIFVLRPGYWITIDSAFARANGFLQKGFSIDFQGQTFQLLSGIGAQATPVDANYLVMKLDLTAQKKQP